MKKIYLLIIAIAFTTVGFGQIAYFNNFDTPVPSGTTYTGNPTLATNITGGAWTTSAGSFTSFGGNTGNALSLNNSGGTTTMTLTLTVASGFKLDLTSYDFWRQRSSTGAQNYSLNIAGNSAGTGTVPTTGALIGSQPVAINNITGTFTVVLTLTGASGTGTFRLDDFQLNGVVSALCTAPSTQATNFNTTAITTNSATLNWTRGTGDNVLVLVRQGSAVTTNPTSGTDYTGANPSFGTGTQLGTGNYIVYNGPATSINVTNLAVGNTYHVAIYEYNNTGFCYKTPALTGNFNIPCPAVSLPFTEGFESTTFPPACWATFRGANNTGTSFDWSRSTTARTGTGAAFVRWESNGSSNEDWLVSPGIALTSGATNTLTYWNRGDNFTGSTYTVRVSTTSQTDRTSFTTVLSYVSPLATTYAQRTVNLSAYAGSTVYIAFVMTNSNGDSWYIDDVSVTASAVGNSTNSNIVDNNFTPTIDINYIAFPALSGLTTTNSIKIGEFKIQDGGNTLNDADLLSTTLTSLGFTVANFGNIAALAIFDGTTNVREVTNVTASTTFNILNLVAPDNDSKIFSVYATFKSTVTDNQQIRLTVASATANPSGSTFATPVGGAQTSIAGDANRIEVTATALAFVQQPSNTPVNDVMATSPTVRAIDVNLNRDLDFDSSVSVSTTGTFAGSATTSATAVAGIATFNNLRFSAPGTGLTLTTVSGLTNATSSTFDVSTVGWQIGAVNQLYTIDFDNTVANVNNGTYAGTGFRPNPIVGQLNSGAWESTGMSDGDLTFGGTRTTSDYASGISTGNETSGGFYAFEVAPNNHTFGFQPTGSDFAPGTVTLKVQNQTGQTVTSVRFQYLIYVRNDQGRSSSLNFSFSYDNSNYGPVSNLDYTSPAGAAGTSWIAVPRDYTVTGLTIPDGSFVYARWTSDDVAGSGSRDEFGLDDIQVIFDPIPASNSSNIITTNFAEPSNIDYLAYSASSGLTNGNAIKIGEFSIQDGGNNLSDPDNLPTILTDIGFSVQNFNNIAALAIFDGSTNVKEVTSVTAITNFNDLTLTAPDNSSKVFSIYATFKTTVADNAQLRLTVNSAVASIAGSGFPAADASDASTSVAGDANRIEVTATALTFSQQPSDTVVNQTMTPAVTVSSIDVNNNLDVDYTTDVYITSSGTLSGSPVVASPTSGVATFNNLVHTAIGTGLTLTASSGVFTSVESASFNIIPATEVIALEDFDATTPIWSNDIASQLFEDPSSSDEGLFIQPNSGNNANFSGNSAFGKDLEGEDGEPSLAPYVFTFESVDVSLYTNITFSFDYYAFANADAGSYELFYDDVSQGAVVFYDDPDTVAAIGTVSVSIPNGTSTVALIVTGTLNGSNDVLELDNFKIVGTPPASVDYVYNNGWTPGDPSGVSTRFDNIQILAGTTNLTAPTVAKNLTIDSGTTLNIEPIASLTTRLTFTNNGTLTLNSTSVRYSSLIANSVSGGGSNNYNRHVNGQPNVGVGTGANDLVSPPFYGQAFNDFRAANSNIRSNGNVDPLAALYVFGPFEKSSGTYLTYAGSETATLDPGIGYRAASTDNGSFTFTGNMITSNLDVPIEISGTSFAIWNLIGNPYPSYIKLSEFLNLNSSKFNASRSGVYGYNGDSGSFEIWNDVYSIANPNAVITPGQGFLVASALPQVDVNFTSAMRTTGTSDDFIPLRMSNQSLAYVQLKANISAKDYKTDFYFTDLASRGLDPGFDSGVFGSGAGANGIYSELVENNSGIDMGIQSIPFTDLGTDVRIPIGIHASQGQQVRVSMLNATLPDGITVFLEDQLTNVFTQLNTNEYVFTANSNINTIGRFYLRFNDNTLSNGTPDLNSLQVYTVDQTLHVNGLLNADTNVSLFDIQGRKVLTSNLKTGTMNNSIDVSGVSTGVYVVKLSNSTQEKTQRVIIK